MDVKIDVCGHCLFRARHNPRRTIGGLCARLGVDPAPYARYLDVLALRESDPRFASRHAFLGVGIHPARGPRVNVYLEPAAPSAVAARTTPVRKSPTAATAAAVEAILARQIDGVWSDYRLPVGTSTSWTTAYVGNALQDAADMAGPRTLQASLEKAADALAGRARADGWGYNEVVEVDADSSALATLFLRRAGRHPDPLPLLQFHEFGTFRRDDVADSWGHAHADVVPTVGRALRACGSPVASDAVAAVRLSRQPTGAWKSYWWESDLYATAACLRFLAEGDEPAGDMAGFFRHVRPRDAFECALALVIACAAGERMLVTHLLSHLLSLQQPDGLWAPSAWLRVTDSNAALTFPSGHLYLDDGLFTSATALSALAAALA